MSRLRHERLLADPLLFRHHSLEVFHLRNMKEKPESHDIKNEKSSRSHESLVLTTFLSNNIQNEKSSRPQESLVHITYLSDNIKNEKSSRPQEALVLIPFLFCGCFLH